MARKLASIALLTVAFALPQAASALGLGEITMKSALNERMNAEIELVSVRPEDLAGLQVSLAPAETFERYGLDRPAVLTRLRFAVSRSTDGRAVIRVTSSEPVREPFLSFLVEARWPNGRLLREYTVLLDPPTFIDETPAAAAPQRSAPPVSQQPAAPVTSTRSSGDRVQVPTQPSPRATAPSTRSTPARSGVSYGGDYGMIQRNETLWGIASRLRPDDVTINQMMVALYRANPEAFDGNINRMKAGYVLRIPALDEIRAVSREAAFAQVRDHNRQWRGEPATRSTAGSSTRQDSEARLSLVAPEGASSTGTGAGGVDPELAAEVDRLSQELSEERAANRLLGEQVVELQGEVDETERLLSVKDGQIARLQQQLRETGEAVDAVPDQPFEEFADESAPTSDMIGDDAEATDSDRIVDESAATDEGVDAASDMAGLEGADETATDTTEAADETAAPAQPAPSTSAPVRRAPEPSLMDRVMGMLGDPLILGGAIGGLLILILGFLGLRKLRSGKGGTEEKNWTVSDLGDDGEADTPTEVAATAAGGGDGVEDLFQHPEPAAPGEDWPATEKVDEEAPEEKTIVVDPKPAQDDAGGEELDPFAQTIAGAPAVSMDDSDPVSEADFHMAYGLYDQAADLLTRSIESDPERHDLKLKLLEVFFVWGNKDDFVSHAEKYKPELSTTADWDNVVIMGKQIAPEAELFTGAATTAGGAEASVDMDFGDDEGSQAEADLDIFGDLGADLGDDLTGEAPASEPAPAPADDGGDIEFDLGDMTGGGEAPAAEAPAADDDLGLDLDMGLGDDSAAEPAPAAAETGGDDDALEFDLGEAAAEPEAATDEEASLPAASDDELALDLDSLAADDSDEVSVDSPPGEEDSQTEFDKALGELSSFVDTNVDEDEATGGELDLSGEDEDSLGGIEFEAGDSDDGADQLADGSLNEEDWSLDESAGGDDSEGGDSLDEVSTKLDLARAYVDMGDPDGARSILEEVVAEGDEQQKAAAEALLAEL